MTPTPHHCSLIGSIQPSRASFTDTLLHNLSWNIKRFICSSAVSATNNCPVQRFCWAAGRCSGTMDFHQVKEWQKILSVLVRWCDSRCNIRPCRFSAHWMDLCLQEVTLAESPEGAVNLLLFEGLILTDEHVHFYCEEAFKGSAFVHRTRVILHNHHLATVYIAFLNKYHK